MTRPAKLVIAAVILAVLAIGSTAYVTAPGPVEIQVRVHYALLRKDLMADLDQHMKLASERKYNIPGTMREYVRALRRLEREEERAIQEGRAVDRAVKSAEWRAERSGWLAR